MSKSDQDGVRKMKYRKCDTCGYEQSPEEAAAERSEQEKMFVPLGGTCPKCGAHTFYLTNIRFG